MNGFTCARGGNSYIICGPINTSRCHIVFNFDMGPHDGKKAVFNEIYVYRYTINMGYSDDK